MFIVTCIYCGRIYSAKKSCRQHPNQSIIPECLVSKRFPFVSVFEAGTIKESVQQPIEERDVQLSMRQWGCWARAGVDYAMVALFPIFRIPDPRGRRCYVVTVYVTSYHTWGYVLCTVYCGRKNPAIFMWNTYKIVKSLLFIIRFIILFKNDTLLK